MLSVIHELGLGIRKKPGRIKMPRTQKDRRWAVGKMGSNGIGNAEFGMKKNRR
jgi:hypothetical protein